MTEPPKRDTPAAASAAKVLRPRDAATLIVVDETGPEPLILMGRRRADLVFMPGKYVFPGGRVDRADGSVASATELEPREAAKVLIDMKGKASPARARALAIAAVREAFEEAGLLVGRPPAVPPAATPADSPPWAAFFGTGHAPDLAALRLVARAITPPGRARRFDTRFFTVSTAAIALRTGTIDDELGGIDWFTFEDARALDLPSITRAVIEDLADQLRVAPPARANLPVPFYFFRAGTFRRELLSLAIGQT